MITVHFPAPLHALAGKSLQVGEPVSTLGQLIGALDRIKPGLAGELDDPLYNFAVNDEILLRAVEEHPVHDGDTVEIIPTIAGG